MFAFLESRLFRLQIAAVVMLWLAPHVCETTLADNAAASDDQVFDLRYAPKRWQTAICLPDDPHKSIVGSDGALYYDYDRHSGRFYGFTMRLKAGLAGAKDMLHFVGQKLDDPRVPIVETEWRAKGLALTTVAWAAAPEGNTPQEWAPGRHDYYWVKLTNRGLAPAKGRLELHIDSDRPLVKGREAGTLVYDNEDGGTFCTLWPPPEKVGQESSDRLWSSQGASVHKNWAAPDAGVDSRFRHVLIGWNRPLTFCFRADPGAKYRVALGIIEGYHDRAGIRPLDIRVEGSPSRKVDPIAERGKNRPVVVMLDAEDANGDGLIDIAVHTAPGATDRNSILSALWVFPVQSAPQPEKLITGGADEGALAIADHQNGGAASPPVRYPEIELLPGEEYQVLVAVHRGDRARPRVSSIADAARERERAASYWREMNLPYDRIKLPDPAMQGLLDSCIRNIYQARELRDGVPAFQVGPTCYRGIWAADGPFILEAITYLGRWEETRHGLELLARGDEGPQGVAFSKQSGLRLWMILRHAQLTGDLDWLGKMWPTVTSEVKRIQDFREMTRDDPLAANYGLMPIGYGDGGLGGKHREYTNVYWNLAGMRAALEMAKLLEKQDELSDWNAEYEDFWKTFDRARNRDKLADDYGNTYVPVTMKGEEPQLPQRGAWAFLQSVFPGRVFESDDELMLGTMTMLEANEREGLIFGTGWLADGIWNYAASFYGHAELWLGRGRKASDILYAFANHASPLLCWREEQNLVGDDEKYVGDMPHNWASAEFIRMVRHLILLERGRELHLLEGLPIAWTKPSAVTSLQKIATTFGETSVRLNMSPDGRRAKLEVDPPSREAPERIVVHLERFECEVNRVTQGAENLDAKEGMVSVTAKSPFSLEIEFAK